MSNRSIVGRSSVLAALFRTDLDLTFRSCAMKCLVLLCDKADQSFLLLLFMFLYILCLFFILCNCISISFIFLQGLYEHGYKLIKLIV